MRKAVLCVRDMGPAKSAVATIPHLQKEGVTCELWCEEFGKAVDVAKSHKIAHHTFLNTDNDPEKLFGESAASTVLVVGFSSPIRAEQIAALGAVRARIPWVGLEDQAGVSSRCTLKPDLILTPDMLGKEHAKELWGEHQPVMIVGSHAVTETVAVPSEDAITWAQKEWGNRPIIVFSEFGLPENGAAEEQIVAVIRLIRHLPSEWRLCLRLHPKWERTPSLSSAGETFSDYLRSHFNVVAERLVPSPPRASSEEVIALPQVKAVVAGGATSSLTAAVCSGKVALSLTGERTRKMLRADFAGATQAPIVRLGLCEEADVNDSRIDSRFLSLIPVPMDRVHDRLRPFNGRAAAHAIMSLFRA